MSTNNIVIYFLIIVAGLVIISCTKTYVGRVAYEISEKDLIPEGITYSSTTNSFYLSSIHKTKIIRIEAETGDVSDFITSDLVGMNFLGLITDDTRNNLWACCNRGNNSAVVKFNLQTGELINSYSISDNTENLFNDLILDKKGNTYFTNTNQQTIYRIDQQTDSLTIFFDENEIIHPNGITISPDDKYLYIASNEKGIRIMDIISRKIINEPDNTNTSTGIDGLKYYKNSLIGIQNEVKSRSDMKIAKYYLNRNGTKITKRTIIDQNGPHFDIPTTFVIRNNNLYCLANSQLANIDSNNKIRSYEALDDIIILKYDL